MTLNHDGAIESVEEPFYCMRQQNSSACDTLWPYVLDTEIGIQRERKKKQRRLVWAEQKLDNKNSKGPLVTHVSGETKQKGKLLGKSR